MDEDGDPDDVLAIESVNAEADDVLEPISIDEDEELDDVAEPEGLAILDASDEDEEDAVPRSDETLPDALELMLEVEACETLPLPDEEVVDEGMPESLADIDGLVGALIELLVEADELDDADPVVDDIDMDPDDEDVDEAADCEAEDEPPNDAPCITAATTLRSLAKNCGSEFLR